MPPLLQEGLSAFFNLTFQIKSKAKLSLGPSSPHLVVLGDLWDVGVQTPGRLHRKEAAEEG